MFDKTKNFFRKEISKDVLLVGILFICILVFFLANRVSVSFHDGIDYFFTANSPLAAEATHRHMRYGLIWPLWLLQQIFGYSELSFYTLPFIGMQVLVIGTFLLGRVLFNRPVGVAAALFMLDNPSVVDQGTMILPDYLAPGVFTLGFVIVFVLARKGYLKQKQLAISTVGWLLISGSLLGWSYLIREFILIAFPVIAYVLYIFKARIRSVFWLTLPIFLAFAAEALWNLRVYGNPFMRFLVASDPRESNVIITNLWAIVVQLPSLLLTWTGGWVLVLLFLLAIGSSLWMGRRDPHRWGGLVLWFIGGWLVFTLIALLPILVFGENYTLLRLQKIRYWILIFPPMLVAACGTLYLLAQTVAKKIKFKARYIFGAIILILFSISLTSVQGMISNHLRYWFTDYHEFRAFIRENADQYQTIWLNQPDQYTSVRTIPMFFLEWHGLSTVWEREIRFYNHDPKHYLRLSELTTGLLVVDLSAIGYLASQHKLPGYILDLNRLGIPVFESSHGRILAFELPPPY